MKSNQSFISSRHGSRLLAIAGLGATLIAMTPAAQAHYTYSCDYVSNISLTGDYLHGNLIQPSATYMQVDLTAAGGPSLNIMKGSVPMALANYGFKANPNAAIPERCTTVAHSNDRGYPASQPSAINSAPIAACPDHLSTKTVSVTLPDIYTDAHAKQVMVAACQQYQRENPTWSGLAYISTASARRYGVPTSAAIYMNVHYQLERTIQPWNGTAPYTDVMAQYDCSTNQAVIAPIALTCNLPTPSPIAGKLGSPVNIGTIGGILTPPATTLNSGAISSTSNTGTLPTPAPAPIRPPVVGCINKDCTSPPIIVLPQEM